MSGSALGEVQRFFLLFLLDNWKIRIQEAQKNLRIRIRNTGPLRCGSGNEKKKFVLPRSAGAEPQAGELGGANPAAARALFNRQSMTAPRRWTQPSSIPVLRIRDPCPVAFLTPGSGMGKNSGLERTIRIFWFKKIVFCFVFVLFSSYKIFYFRVQRTTQSPRLLGTVPYLSTQPYMYWIEYLFFLQPLISWKYYNDDQLCLLALNLKLSMHLGLSLLQGICRWVFAGDAGWADEEWPPNMTMSIGHVFFRGPRI